MFQKSVEVYFTPTKFADVKFDIDDWKMICKKFVEYLQINPLNKDVALLDYNIESLKFKKDLHALGGIPVQIVVTNKLNESFLIKIFTEYVNGKIALEHIEHVKQ